MTQSLSKINLIGFRTSCKRGQSSSGASTPLVGPLPIWLAKSMMRQGDRLTPSRSKKSSGRVIRYYYSNRLISGGADPTGWRLRADMLEQLLSEIVEAKAYRSTHTVQVGTADEAPCVKRGQRAFGTLDIKGHVGSNQAG